MADVSFGTQATASVESIALLDQLDPPSPVITVTDEDISPIEPQGVSLAQELENLGLTGMTNNNTT